MPFDVPIIIGLRVLGKLRNSNIMFYKTNHKTFLMFNFKTTSNMIIMVHSQFFRYNQVRQIRKILICLIVDWLLCECIKALTAGIEPDHYCVKSWFG